jgi:hypothetical protein
MLMHDGICIAVYDTVLPELTYVLSTAHVPAYVIHSDWRYSCKSSDR